MAPIGILKTQSGSVRAGAGEPAAAPHHSYRKPANDSRPSFPNTYSTHGTELMSAWVKQVHGENPNYRAEFEPKAPKCWACTCYTWLHPSVSLRGGSYVH